MRSPNLAPFNIQQLYIDGVESNWHQLNSLNAKATGCILGESNSGITWSQVTLNNVRTELQTNLVGATDTMIYLPNPADVIANLVVQNSYLTDGNPNNGYGLYEASGYGSATHAVWNNNYINGLAAVERAYTATDIVLNDNTITCSSNCQGVGINVAGVRVHVRGNYLNNGAYGLVRWNGVFASTVYSDGDNTMAGSGSLLVGNPGSSNANLAGSTIINGIDHAALVTPTVNSCGASSSVVGNAVAGAITVTAATTSCVYNLPSAYPIAPKGCTATDQSTGVGVGCLITYTSLATETMTLTGSTIGGTVVNYSVQP